jgi:hypothetical protein
MWPQSSVILSARLVARLKRATLRRLLAQMFAATEIVWE